jgi:hypothetical protein
MHKTIFHAVPAMRCHCPAKIFRKARQALRYAQEAADTFEVAYAVWRVRKGTLRLLRRYPPAHVQVRAWQQHGTEKRPTHPSFSEE